MQPMENKIVFDERSFQRIEKKEKDLGTVYHRSLWKDIVSEIKSNPVAIFAVIFLIIIIVASLLAPLSPYDPNKLDLANKFAAPSMQHPFGCDEYGRDYFTRALYGGRVSLMVGFAAMLVTVFIGTTIGIFSGYIGGKLDMLLMRFTDLMMAFPALLLAIALAAIFQPSVWIVSLVIAMVNWVQIARVTYAETSALSARDFIAVERTLGAGTLRILGVHLIPHLAPTVLVWATLGISTTVLLEATLSFLGVGVQPPTPSWGNIIFESQSYFTSAPWLVFFPGAAIVLLSLSFNIAGDALRDALDPGLKGRN